MKNRFYTLLSIVCCCVVTAFCMGCDGGGGDDDSSDAAATNGAAASAAPSSEVLGSGDKTVVAGGPVVTLGPYTAPGDGDIVAKITWSEGTQIIAFFKKSGPANFGWVKGASTLTSTAAVAKDETVTLYLVNDGGVNAATQVTVTYVP
jgi:hypothetical protein